MSECGLFWVGETIFWVVGVRGALFWVGRGEWRLLGHYFGWVEVSGALFWVGGDEWGLVHCGGLSLDVFSRFSSK